MSRVNVTIDTAKVAQLIKAGHLCAADLQCLDRDSKQTLWQLCLWSCQHRVGCQNTQCQHPCNSENNLQNSISKPISILNYVES
ncbi:hypothetical protein GCM10009347_22430 [Shewanella algicola]|uniref:Uncharacterized protein n=1 Tax=Shewanella algicola TaxID=640633 RepID=A0A9X1Z846_9GAMM|nr:hypothetical protein [Shewanella algicola]MCL1105779.1 hypothetical protein [Shewanella algicola]GGP55171.1 hypothetical protein GCM10009347_22430 [Shewanella algicola]